MRVRLRNKKSWKERKLEIKRVFSILRQTEIELGRNNENRVLDAFTDGNQWVSHIPWIIGVRKATEEEDKYRGIDVVFNTDVGAIGLQVKSSEFGRLRFIKRQAKGEVSPDIVTITVYPWSSPEEIRGAVVSLLSGERRRRLGLKMRVPNSF